MRVQLRDASEKDIQNSGAGLSSVSPELNTVVNKLYEDYALGRITGER